MYLHAPVEHGMHSNRERRNPPSPESILHRTRDCFGHKLGPLAQIPIYARRADGTNFHAQSPSRLISFAAIPVARRAFRSSLRADSDVVASTVKSLPPSAPSAGVRGNIIGAKSSAVRFLRSGGRSSHTETPKIPRSDMT